MFLFKLPVPPPDNLRQNNLHSTMFLFKSSILCSCLPKLLNLHSTMFLFKSLPHLQIHKRVLDLHSTMFLFKFLPLSGFLYSVIDLHSTMFLFKSVSSHLNNSTACNHHFCLRTLKFKITYSSYDTQIHQDLINSVLSTLRNFYII